MKVKLQPEDFQVEELTDIVPTEQGDFALYRLEKRGLSTPDALAAVRRRWRMEPRRIGYGGLKDRHACTVQYLTILRGPQRNLQQPGLTVTYLGQVPVAYSSTAIRANRFLVTVRDLDASSIRTAQQALLEVQQDGLPNYFDDQRFGSVRGGVFLGRLLVEGRFEEALQTALTDPYEFDRSSQKREKALLRKHWGDWTTLAQRLARGPTRGLVDYLRHHPSDFRGAVARLHPELRGLYLSAYQSDLWNRMLALWIQRFCRPQQLGTLSLKRGKLPSVHSLEEVQRQSLLNLQIPLPSARLSLDPTDPRAEIVQAILAEEGLELRQLKVPGIRELFFSKGERAAWCLPARLQSDSGTDELQPGRQKLVLSFELSRGSYATLVMKRLVS